MTRPPTPRTSAEAEPGGDSTQAEALPRGEMLELAAELQEVHHWPLGHTMQAIDTALHAGRAWPAIRAMLRRLAADPDTRGPQRLNAPLPADWWTQTSRGPDTRPAWCGECDPQTRQFDLGHTIIRCSKCHPQGDNWPGVRPSSTVAS